MGLKKNGDGGRPKQLIKKVRSSGRKKGQKKSIASTRAKAVWVKTEGSKTPQSESGNNGRTGGSQLSNAEVIQLARRNAWEATHCCEQ